MKTVVLSAFMLLLYNLKAQTVEGIVYAIGNEALPFAAVTLNDKKDSVLVKATVTDEEGYFYLKGITAGTYRLSISTLGYADYEIDLAYNGLNLHLGAIYLETSVENLEEVTVTAEKPIVQVMADKTVFNVTNTINATGSSALELLRKAPGVIMDNTGGIIVEGKTGVQIFVDGKLSVLQGSDLTNFLESLQATDIEAVEIITQPSSKFDAAGNAGIINIKLRKDMALGTNGTVTSGITVGDFARYTSNTNFNVRGKKANIYGSYSNRFGKGTGFLNLLRQQSGTRFNARTRSINDGNTNNLRLGYDLYSSPKSTFGILLNGNFNNSFSDSDSRTPIRSLGAIANDSVLVTKARSRNNSNNLNANLNYSYKDTLGHTINVDLDYGSYTSDRNAFQPNVYFNGDGTEILRENITAQETPIAIKISTVKIDYEQPLFHGIMAVGLKFAYVDTDNTFDFFNRINGVLVQDNDRSNTFGYSEQVNAAYVNYDRKWTKWNLQLGLRAEQTISEGSLESMQLSTADKVSRDYIDLFPSGGLTYQIDRKNRLALTYSKRIQRPNYQSLNPFEYVIDELSFRKGNPFLQPQYTDNLKFSHTFNYRLTTSFGYSYISDFFAQVTVADGNSKNFITTRNVADNEVLNLGLSYPKKIRDWWDLYLSLNAYTSNFKPTSPEFLAVKQETLSLYVQHTFLLPNSFRMEVSGWFSSPSIWGGTYRTQALGSLNIAFQKKLLNDRISVRLAFNDILYTVPWQGTTQFGNLFIDGSGGSDSRQVAFSLSYDFGRDSIKKIRDRKSGSEDENKRIEN